MIKLSFRKTYILLTRICSTMIPLSTSEDLAVSGVCLASTCQLLRDVTSQVNLHTVRTSWVCFFTKSFSVLPALPIMQDPHKSEDFGFFLTAGGLRRSQVTLRGPQVALRWPQVACGGRRWPAGSQVTLRYDKIYKTLKPYLS